VLGAVRREIDAELQAHTAAAGASAIGKGGELIRQCQAGPQAWFCKGLVVNATLKDAD
jgi:hypothetical protein